MLTELNRQCLEALTEMENKVWQVHHGALGLSQRSAKQLVKGSVNDIRDYWLDCHRWMAQQTSNPTKKQIYTAFVRLIHQRFIVDDFTEKPMFTGSTVICWHEKYYNCLAMAWVVALVLGEYVEKSCLLSTKISWYEKNTLQTDGHAMVWLGHCYYSVNYPLNNALKPDTTNRLAKHNLRFTGFDIMGHVSSQLFFERLVLTAYAQVAWVMEEQAKMRKELNEKIEALSRNQP